MLRKENKSMINSPSPKSWKGFMEEIPPLSDDFSVEGDELPSDLPRPTPFKKGYQIVRLMEGYVPDQQRGHQPVANQRTPANPPSNPPNQGTGGKNG